MLYCLQALVRCVIWNFLKDFMKHYLFTTAFAALITMATYANSNECDFIARRKSFPLRNVEDVGNYERFRIAVRRALVFNTGFIPFFAYNDHRLVCDANIEAYLQSSSEYLQDFPEIFSLEYGPISLIIPDSNSFRAYSFATLSEAAMFAQKCERFCQTRPTERAFSQWYVATRRRISNVEFRGFLSRDRDYRQMARYLQNLQSESE